jgi:hypothetical protein
MTRPFWRMSVLIALLLVANLGIEAQRLRGRRAIEVNRYKSAAMEIGRTNPRLAKKLRKALTSMPEHSHVFLDEKRPEKLGAILRKQLQTQKLTLQTGNHDQQERFKLSIRNVSDVVEDPRLLSANDELIGRKLLEIKKRDETLEKMDAEEVARLEPLRRGKRATSTLENRLKRVGVTDFKVVARSFDVHCEVHEMRLKKEVTLLRIFGGASKPIGRYLFCCLEASENMPQSVQRLTGEYARWTDASGLATPPENLMEDLALVKLPAGTRFFSGVVADNFEDAGGNIKLGGNTQIFLPSVKDFPFEHYRLAEGGAEASDIIALFDEGRSLRFRPAPSVKGSTR